MRQLAHQLSGGEIDALAAYLAGKEFRYSLADALAAGPVVVYFHPSAYTNGCNIQAHTFAENIGRFREAGASVVGVSPDDIRRLKTFSADPDYCAGKLIVAADTDGRIARSYQVDIRDPRGEAIDHGFAESTRFVVDREGKINAIIGGLAPAENLARALDIVRGLATRSRQRSPTARKAIVV